MTTRVYTDAEAIVALQDLGTTEEENEIRLITMSLLAERQAAQPDTKDVPFGYVSSKAPFGIDRSSFRTSPAPHWDIPLYLHPPKSDDAVKEIPELIPGVNEALAWLKIRV